jgi:hypothetical protein
MPKYTIVETIVERREVEADTAQAALDAWLIGGTPVEHTIEVTERYVEDADGNECETEERGDAEA